MTAPSKAPEITKNVTSPTIRRPVKRSKIPLLDLAQSAIGKKWIMAITGIGLMGFVLLHMVGNLKMYLGAEDFNHYSEFLRELLVPILPRTVVMWLLRIGVIAMFAGHIWAAVSLAQTNKKARPVAYKSQRDYIAVTWAARTMKFTGPIIALFLVWHLADLTWGWHFVNPDFVRGHAYENLAASLSRIPVAALYIVANLALGYHLFHGAWSIFQSIGSMNPNFNPRRNPIRKGFAAAFAIVVAGVNITFPLAVQFGIVG